MLNIGMISKIANRIRRAVAEKYSVKTGDVDYKLCFNIARHGGNEVTVINALSANKEFLGQLVKIRKTVSGFFRCFVDGRFFQVVLGNSAGEVAKAVTRSIGLLGKMGVVTVEHV